MNKGELKQTIKKLLVSGKGILAADESVETIGKRFAALGIENIEPNREAYREMLFTSPGFNDYVSGVILFDETLREKTADGKPLRKILEKQKIVIGCKVDQGLTPLIHSENEYATKGLEGLFDRLDEYYSLGVRFAKWRSVFVIGKGLPSYRSIEKSAQMFATYAKTCHQAGIVPIVEPEVLSNGKHSMDDCYNVTQIVLQRVFSVLKDAKVDLQNILLKPNMVVPGLESKEKIDPRKVAKETIDCLKASVPAEVPGIVFLSGGQTEKEACQNLNAIAEHQDLPWKITYSFGRALQNSALEEWGEKSRTDRAQKAFLQRAKLVSLAQMGKYTVKLEKRDKKVETV